MAPIATYREWRLERKCEFELYPDSIRAAGKVALGRFEVTIPLSTLDPNLERLWIFSRLFYSSAVLFVVGLVALGIVVIGLNNGTFDSRASFWGSSALMGFVMLLFSSRKVEMAMFRSVAGVPRLSIARSGKQPGEFDSFVAKLVEQIVANNAKLTDD
jgi:hypothetical protein